MNLYISITNEYFFFTLKAINAMPHTYIINTDSDTKSLDALPMTLTPAVTSYTAAKHHTFITPGPSASHVL